MKKLGILLILLLLLTACHPAAEAPLPTTEPGPLAGMVMAVDAGHGGVDQGCVGIDGALEAPLNLAIARVLKKELERRDATVIMTREDESVVYEDDGTTKKQQDMRHRAEKIADARLLISIHLNAFSNQGVCGAQTFFDADHQGTQQLAQLIQAELNALPWQEHPRDALSGDYYLLRVPPCTGVLVECGFLSNPREALLLADPVCQELLAQAIVRGIESFFM